MSVISNVFAPSSAPSGTSSTTSTQSQPAIDPLANESTFLKLLVSQLQNQDPLNPTDSTQFVSQLTAYSQLEQLIGIHQNTTALSSGAAGSQTTSTTGK